MSSCICIIVNNLKKAKNHQLTAGDPVTTKLLDGMRVPQSRQERVLDHSWVFFYLFDLLLSTIIIFL